MRFLKAILRYVFGAAMVAIGVTHFTDEGMFLKIMPDYIPLSLHRPAVMVSGAAEILLGVLLILPWTSRLAGWGLIALFVAVFPANIYLYQHPEIMPDVSPTAHLIRLPIQAVLIAWAYWYTRPDKPRTRESINETSG
ncbi:MAG: MauE/DoxX family redox-associated membrane protein [Pirellulales bacterium]